MKVWREVSKCNIRFYNMTPCIRDYNPMDYTTLMSNPYFNGLHGYLIVVMQTYQEEHLV